MQVSRSDRPFTGPQETLLVTGASGFLGWNLCQQAAQRWRVVGTYGAHPVAIAGVEMRPVDLTDEGAIAALMASVQPAAVIHLAAQSSPNICQRSPEVSHRINVDAAVLLAKLCADRAIPLVFTSTDLVFDGRRSPYREADPVNPISVYGEQKAIAEEKILSLYPWATVCRMPLMFGEAGPVAKSFLQWMLETLRSGQELALFTDEFRTPVSGRAAVQGLLLALQQGVSGLLHLGGPERIARYEFGQRLAEVMDLPRDLIRPCSQASVASAAPRPADVSLVSTQAFGLGYRPQSLLAELTALRGRV